MCSSDLEDSGFRDFFEEHAICLVEWPDKAGGLLPHADLEIVLSYDIKEDANPALAGRQIEVSAASPRGEALVKQMIEQQ